MQEPVYVLLLITCHRRIMPRLSELLLSYFPWNLSKYKCSLNVQYNMTPKMGQTSMFL